MTNERLAPVADKTTCPHVRGWRMLRLVWSTVCVSGRVEYQCHACGIVIALPSAQ